MNLAEPPSTLPRRPHRRAKPRLSTDNEAVAAQLGRSGRMGARLEGGGEVGDGWVKRRPSWRPYWWAPPFWARPLTDLSLCDRRRGRSCRAGGGVRGCLSSARTPGGSSPCSSRLGGRRAREGMSLLIRAVVPPPSAAASLAPSSRRLSPPPQLHWGYGWLAGRRGHLG